MESTPSQIFPNDVYYGGLHNQILSKHQCVYVTVVLLLFKELTSTIRKLSLAPKQGVM